MKRSEVNSAIQTASRFFKANGWHLPPNPRWDVTDFGLGNFSEYGLILINLAEEPEYCEKLMFAQKNQKTPAHAHKKKKEDIIVRTGSMAIQIWNGEPGWHDNEEIYIQVNGQKRTFLSGEILELAAGERVTLFPFLYHEFWPTSDNCIIGEVSTANDDANDNFFINPNIGRFSEIEEDEPALVKLVSDK